MAYEKLTNCKYSVITKGKKWFYFYVKTLDTYLDVTLFQSWNCSDCFITKTLPKWTLYSDHQINWHKTLKLTEKNTMCRPFFHWLWNQVIYFVIFLKSGYIRTEQNLLTIKSFIDSNISQSVGNIQTVSFPSANLIRYRMTT